MMRFLTHTFRPGLAVTVVVVVVRLGALLVVVVAVPEAMLGSFARAGHTMTAAIMLARVGGVMNNPFVWLPGGEMIAGGSPLWKFLANMSSTNFAPLRPGHFPGIAVLPAAGTLRACSGIACPSRSAASCREPPVRRGGSAVADWPPALPRMTRHERNDRSTQNFF